MTFEDFWENYENETGYYSDEMFDCAQAAWDARGKRDIDIIEQWEFDPDEPLIEFYDQMMKEIKRG